MRTRASLTAIAIAIAIAATLLSACGETGDTTKASETAGRGTEPAPSAPTPPVDPTTAPPVETGNDPEKKPGKTDPSGPYDLVPQHLRVEERADGDRVVLTFRGRGTAGWTATYVDQAVLDGSGRVVDLDADTVLGIGVFGTPTGASDRIRTVPTKVGGEVTDAYVGAAWEGVTQVFLGLEGGRVPYRISALSSPSRLVIDLGSHP